MLKPMLKCLQRMFKVFLCKTWVKLKASTFQQKLSLRTKYKAVVYIEEEIAEFSNKYKNYWNFKIFLTKLKFYYNKRKFECLFLDKGQ